MSADLNHLRVFVGFLNHLSEKGVFKKFRRFLNIQNAKMKRKRRENEVFDTWERRRCSKFSPAALKLLMDFAITMVSGILTNFRSILRN